MANLKSSEKDIRRITRKTERNRTVRTRLKNLRKGALEATAKGDAQAPAAVQALASGLDKAVKRGVIHRNKANRLKSRMAAKAAPAKA